MLARGGNCGEMISITDLQNPSFADRIQRAYGYTGRKFWVKPGYPPPSSASACRPDPPAAGRGLARRSDRPAQGRHQFGFLSTALLKDNAGQTVGLMVWPRTWRAQTRRKNRSDFWRTSCTTPMK
jgi:hypothetical protein